MTSFTTKKVSMYGTDTEPINGVSNAYPTPKGAIKQPCLLGVFGLRNSSKSYAVSKIVNQAQKQKTFDRIGLASALGGESTQSRAAQAQAVKLVLDQGGRGLEMPTVSKTHAKKAKTAGKKALNIGLNLTDEFGPAKTRAQSAKGLKGEGNHHRKRQTRG